LDFGCGTGRFVRFFAANGFSVIGTEITMEMLAQARQFGLPPGCLLVQTDGISIPLADQSVDTIWVCGVLKYSLFPPGSICRGGIGVAEKGQGGSSPDEKPFIPCYQDIAREMYRVLKPGGWVTNLEMYVDSPPEAFTRDFEQVGFLTKDKRLLQWHGGRLETACQSQWLPVRWMSRLGQWCAAFRFRQKRFERTRRGVCDYWFVWAKPKHRSPEHRV
jgi:ubiquinone/menaquinone biosynthesis C-methylase UbiE